MLDFSEEIDMTTAIQFKYTLCGASGRQYAIFNKANGMPLLIKTPCLYGFEPHQIDNHRMLTLKLSVFQTPEHLIFEKNLLALQSRIIQVATDKNWLNGEAEAIHSLMVKPYDPSKSPIFRATLKRTTDFFHKGELVTDVDIPTFLNKGSIVETVLYPNIWIHNKKFGCSFYAEKVNKIEGPARGVWGDSNNHFVCVRERDVDTETETKYDGPSSKKRCACEAGLGLDIGCRKPSWP